MEERIQRSRGEFLEISKTSNKEGLPSNVLVTDPVRWYGSASKPVKGARSPSDLIARLSKKSPTFGASMKAGRALVAKRLYSNEDTLRSLRLERGMSQSELATAIDNHQPYIARLENGRVWPSREIIEKLAGLFQVSFGEMSERVAACAKDKMQA